MLYSKNVWANTHKDYLNMQFMLSEWGRIGWTLVLQNHTERKASSNLDLFPQDFWCCCPDSMGYPVGQQRWEECNLLVASKIKIMQQNADLATRAHMNSYCSSELGHWCGRSQAWLSPLFRDVKMLQRPKNKQ